jgi:TRAP-type C4-dicarboxylate transport system permease small subunit
LFDKTVSSCALLAGALVVLVCAVTFYEVVARYVFNAPTTWSIDISTYAMFWACFLGGAYTLREGGHVAVDVIVRRLGVTRRRTIALAVHALGALFFAVVTWRGAVACLEAYELGEVTMSVLRFPLYLPLLAIPVGGALITAQILVSAMETWRGEGAGNR